MQRKPTTSTRPRKNVPYPSFTIMFWKAAPGVEYAHTLQTNAIAMANNDMTPRYVRVPFATASNIMITMPKMERMISGRKRRYSVPEGMKLPSTEYLRQLG